MMEFQDKTEAEEVAGQRVAIMLALASCIGLVLIGLNLAGVWQ